MRAIYTLYYVGVKISRVYHMSKELTLPCSTTSKESLHIFELYIGALLLYNTSQLHVDGSDQILVLYSSVENSTITILHPPTKILPLDHLRISNIAIYLTALGQILRTNLPRRTSRILDLKHWFTSSDEVVVDSTFIVGDARFDDRELDHASGIFGDGACILEADCHVVGGGC